MGSKSNDNNPALVSTTQVGSSLGVTISADKIRALGFVPAEQTGRGTYWHAEQVPGIAVALAQTLAEEFPVKEKQPEAVPVQVEDGDAVRVIGALTHSAVSLEQCADDSWVLEWFPGQFHMGRPGERAMEVWQMQFGQRRFADPLSVLVTVADCYLEQRELERQPEGAARPWWRRVFGG